MSIYDSTRTPLPPGTFPGLPSRWPLKPGIFPEIAPEQLPAVVIIVLFTVAVAAGQYELAAALGTLLAVPQFARQRV
ncbi:hypothetical protein ACFVZW_19285 [Streptomyces sp. NPDC059567]|uniref:hypothetical protein n=1 Tax=Streptomyces sp. NPDC059567 TaxID=3346867 RepID=UPI0036789CFD